MNLQLRFRKTIENEGSSTCLVHAVIQTTVALGIFCVMKCRCYWFSVIMLRALKMYFCATMKIQRACNAGETLVRADPVP